MTFEFFVLVKSFINEKIKFKTISSNRIIYSLELFYKNKKIRMRCSYRLTMLSLKSLSKLSKIEEKTIFPYGILNKDIKKIMSLKESDFNNIEEFNIFTKKYGKTVNIYQILEEYCKNDVLITKKSINKFWEIIEQNGLKNKKKILSAAKLSVENFFEKNKIVKKVINIKHDRLIRNAYYGGRTEVFGNPYDDEILLHYDWSGMYAQCMSEKVLGGKIFESDNIRNINDPGFYLIEFEQNLEKPILPIKKEKLIFANGSFKEWYWFEEIILAMEKGVKINKIEKRISGEYYDYFLKDYININNNIRKISDLHKQIGKNNNNTFYGRLGMNPEKLNEEILSEYPKENIYEKIDEIMGIFLAYKKNNKSISNVSISASITSKARIKLYNGICKVEAVGGRVVYTDTDSIIACFNKNNYKHVLDISLGEVFFDSNKDDTIIIDAVFTMPKTYALKYANGKEIVKIKGFNAKPSFNEFKYCFYNNKIIETINTQWLKKDFQIEQIEQIKKIDLRQLDKRIWTSNLKETIALKL